MQTVILKVVSQTEPVYVQSKKQENGQLAKCNVHLKGIGGDYAEEFEDLKEIRYRDIPHFPVSTAPVRIFLNSMQSIGGEAGFSGT